ncbi:carbohydrate porin [Frateuria aurantia]
MSLNNFSYDVLSHPQARPQHFGGQRPTVSDIQQVIVTYDLAKIGIENGQFVFGLVNYQTTWNAIGPRTRISLSRFAYYQSFDQRRWELKLGYNCNDLEFYGAAVGGSLSSGVFGPSATIPYEVGLTHLPQCAPGLNITYNADNHFYNKLGLQRSLSPGGGQMEHALNRYGVRFGLHGAGLLMIDETGYRRRASDGEGSIWVRAGVIYNNSDYLKPGTSRYSPDNYAGYLLADLQLTQPDSQLPFRGWYLGASANDARHDVNVYDQSAEIRLYGIGIFPSRPFDMISLVYGYTGFSTEIRQHFHGRGRDPAPNAQSLTGNYVAKLLPGLYMNAGVGYTNHPSFYPKAKNSLNLILGLNLFF